MRLVLTAFFGALLGAAAMVAVQANRSPAASSPTAADLEAIVKSHEAPLHEHVEQLLRDVEALHRVPEPARTEATPPPKVDLAPIAARLAALEQKLDALNQTRMDQEAATKAFNDSQKAVAESRARGLRECQRTAVNRNATEKERVAAFKALRDVTTEDGKPAMTHDVLVAIADIAENSPDEDVRLDVYRNMHRADDPAARDTMLHALTHDTSSKVRAKVAEDLDTFVDDPLVESALRTAADSDADSEVKRGALKALAEKFKRKK